VSIIQLEELSKWYGEVIGLNNVTADISEGITGLLGPNGSGKSTMMGLALGQLRPSRGRVTVFGKDPWDNPKILSRIGYCPEGDPFWSNVSGFQFVLLLARLSGLSGAAARNAAHEAIERVAMTEHAGRAIRGYSKGMRQRIKIAQALAHRPELLVLDEPMTGADPIARHDLAALFRELAGLGVHIVVSSHVLHEVEALTSRILMINHGRIVAQGDVRAVRRALLNRPHAIRVRLTEPRRLAAKVAGWDFVSGVTIPASDTIILQTQLPEKAYSLLTQVFLEEELSVAEMSGADDSLEAVFGYLTRPGSKEGA
jgi:ABC-2 type transport system ATP-binding protein